MNDNVKHVIGALLAGLIAFAATGVGNKYFGPDFASAICQKVDGK